MVIISKCTSLHLDAKFLNFEILHIIQLSELFCKCVVGFSFPPATLQLCKLYNLPYACQIENSLIQTIQSWSNDQIISLSFKNLVLELSVFEDFASKVQEVANKNTFQKSIQCAMMLFYHLGQIYDQAMHFGFNLIKSMCGERKICIFKIHLYVFPWGILALHLSCQEQLTARQ